MPPWKEHLYVNKLPMPLSLTISLSPVAPLSMHFCKDPLLSHSKQRSPQEISAKKNKNNKEEISKKTIPLLKMKRFQPMPCPPSVRAFYTLFFQPDFA